jgi:ParB-like chromosome segregation protein Spo0J
MNTEKSYGRELPHYPMVQQIEPWLIDKLVPYAKNPRTHSDAQVAQIAASIAEFGFNCPILVDTNAGIIAGHGRLLAARKLQIKEVPVMVLDHLSDRQKRAYIIADNRLAESAGWDDDVLRNELAELKDADVDLELLGFGDDELRFSAGAGRSRRGRDSRAIGREHPRSTGRAGNPPWRPVADRQASAAVFRLPRS